VGCSRTAHRKSCSSAVEARRHGCYGFHELHGSNGVPAAAKQINSWTRNASTAEHRIYSAPRLSSTCISDARTRPATSNSSRTRPVAVERPHDGDVYSTNPNRLNARLTCLGQQPQRRWHRRHLRQRTDINLTPRH
jgi:hypothetical protein